MLDQADASGDRARGVGGHDLHRLGAHGVVEAVGPAGIDGVVDAVDPLHVGAEAGLAAEVQQHDAQQQPPQ